MRSAVESMRWWTLALVLCLGASSAAADEHVRVILDISGSMKKNDKPRLAPLSTLLLYDLAQPNLTLGDSFEVLPFHPTQKWSNPSAPPPTGVGERIVPRAGGRDAFARALETISYDGQWTYFYPGLRASIDDLESTPGGTRDVRVVVLVTDGLPEKPTREAEKQRIREELLPRLEDTGIRFYVLAFGPAAQKNRSFFDELVRGVRGSVGDVFIDPDGRGLLTSMAEIFSRSFGYTLEPPRSLPGISRLDLSGSVTPERVAVAVFSPGQRAEPSLELTPPSGGQVNQPGGVVHGSSKGAGYSLTWVLSPDDGAYDVDTDAPTGTVAVLRPTRLSLEARPTPPENRPIQRAMAETPFPISILVRPAAGAQGDVPNLEIAARTLGERTSEGYAWTGDWIGPPAGPGSTQTVPEGRLYHLQVEFPADSQDGRELYRGFLEVEARRHEAVIAELTGPTAHPVEVYPRLRLRPIPNRDDALPGPGEAPALDRSQTGCATFTLAVDAGDLPHPQNPTYPLRAVLDASVPVDGPLREATFSLNSLPLEVDGRPGPQPGVWYKGRSLSREELLEEHEVCIHVGRPTTGDPGQPLELPLRLKIQEAPYDAFDVVDPFTLQATILPPAFLERWRSVIAFALGLLGLLATLWYLRDRPTLPDDMRVAVGVPGDSAAPGHALDEPSHLSRILGLVSARPISAPGGRLLGHVVPVDEDLYRFRPTRGARLTPTRAEERAAGTRHGVPVLVHRSYEVEAGDETYTVRLEYAEEETT